MKKVLLLLATLFALTDFAQTTGTITVIDTSMGLPSNYISCLKVVSPTHFWVGTRDKGAARYMSGSWQYFNTHNSLLPDSSINDIEIDRNGKVWISGMAGIGVYNGTSWQKIDSTNSPMRTSVSPQCRFAYTNFVECDSSGTVWIASGNRLIKTTGSGYSVFPTPLQPAGGATITTVCTGTLDPIVAFDIDQKTNTFMVITDMDGPHTFDGTNFTTTGNGIYYNGKIVYTTVGCADSLTHWYKASDVDSANVNNFSSRTEGTWVINTDPSFANFSLYDSTMTGLVKNPGNFFTYGKIAVSPYNRYVWASNTNYLSHFDRTNWFQDTVLHINGNVSAIDFDNTGTVYIGTVPPMVNVTWLRQSQVANRKGLILYKPNYASVGMEDLKADRFKIGPTPTQGMLYIESPDAGSYEIDIKNASGQILMSQKIVQGKNTINLSAYTNGIFFYTISQKHAVIKYGKVVKID